MGKIIINGASLSGNGTFSFFEINSMEFVNLELKSVNLIESVGNISLIELV